MLDGDGERGMAQKRKKVVVQRLYQATEQYLNGEEQALDQVLAPQFVDRMLGSGREGIFTTLQVMRASFSDAHVEVNAMFTDGTIVVVHLTFDLLHTGVFLHIPPTYRRIRFTHVSALRVESGMIVERLWYVSDALTMWQQFGVFTFAPFEQIVQEERLS